MSSDAPVGFDERLRQRAGRTNPDPLNMTPTNHKPSNNIPNTLLSVATISFLLAIFFCLGSATFLTGGLPGYWWTTYQLGFFVAAWSAFHWGEFAVTAGWNREKCSVDSFLLNNGATYHLSNGIALLEYLLILYLKPSLKEYSYITAVGIVMVLAGQALRSAAMIHASTNFSHSVMFSKAERHRLVSDGIYAWFRHPSYAGFFYWALGTQLVLQNPVSFVMFAIILWRFFYYRTRAEEKALIKFFGEDYIQYRARVGTKIPFIP